MLGVSQENLEKKRESQAEISTTSPEDEALKRNTDCVYFLASPLTCKKGSECEYRHSEVARVNPRDCYYWLNGNCMNPKCTFRHPPLDGLLGTRVTTPLGHSLPLMQSVPTPSAQALHVPGKQAVPCIFFQQGYCLKGDLCPFMHAPYSSSDKVAQLAVATPVTEFQSYKKTFGGLQKSTQQKNSQKNVRIPVEVPVQGKSVLTDRAPLRNGFTINETLAVHAGLDDELSKYKPENVHSASSGKSVRSNNSQQVDVLDNQNILNGKDADEFSREHSPGFDVLVDGELGESDYYHNEDQFGGTRIHDERILNAPNDYEVDRMSSYHSMADGDRDMYNDPHGYDSYDHYGRKEQRVSSERMLGGSAHLERRQRPIADNTGRTDESDLRHHLLKQKRGDNSRSVVSRTHSSKNRFDDRIYRPPQRDHMRACESVISSRLRGRIKIPGRSTSPDNRTGSWSERKTDRGRHRGRLSPELLQGRLKERMKGRVQDDLNDEDRISRNSRMSHEFRNNVYENGDRFTGPKSLSELKVGKGERTELHVSDRQLLGKRKYPKLDGAPQQGEGDISFEGPKPLSEILKRKRGVASADYEKGSTSRNNYDNYRKEANENVIISTDTKKTKDVFSSQPVGEASFVQRNEEPKSAAADINVAGEKVKLNLNQSSLQPETEGMIGDEVMEDHEPEAYEQAEGFSDYEQADGEDYNLEEGENLEPEDEYYEEEEDADDFAKKMGVTYS